jgi:hypothetical protein
VGPGDPGATAELLGHRLVQPLKPPAAERVFRHVFQPAAQPRSLGQERRIVELVEEVAWFFVWPHGLSRGHLKVSASNCK